MPVERLAWDLETWLIGPGAVFPKPVCATFCRRDTQGNLVSSLVSNGDPDWVQQIEGIFDWLEQDPAREAVGHNLMGFDLPVLAIHFPYLISRIFNALERGQIRDTQNRGKLLNLAMRGVVDKYYTPDGEKKDIKYSLSNLVAKYLGKDRSAAKGIDANGKQIKEDIWRLNFKSLDGMASKDFPKEARDYALEDADDALLVCEAQDSEARDQFKDFLGHDGKPFDVFKTESLHIAAMFGLSLATYEGFGIDEDVVKFMEGEIVKALRPEQTELLYSSGLYDRATPETSRTLKNGKVRVTAAKPHKLNTKPLAELVVKVHNANKNCDEEGCPSFGKDCHIHGLGPLKKTETGKISCDYEVISELAAFDEVLEQYERLKSIQKISTNEVPKLREALDHGGTIHAPFQELKKTGRTSSNGSNLYPSVNIQQVPRGIMIDEMGPDGQPVLAADGKVKTIKIEPRNAYKARQPGWVLISIDYGFLELCTSAQVVKNVTGHSTLLDKINKGFDPHAFLGSQLAYGLDKDFSDHCREIKAVLPDDIYKVFESLKGAGDEHKKFYKTWRNFSKPTGLGYNGGLGAKTLVAVAKKVYGVEIKSVELAKSFKEIWLKAFPEMRTYLNDYVPNTLGDRAKPQTERARYRYFSPLGMFRNKTTFTEAANGFALQTPSAEGFKVALFDLQRACWDIEKKSCLYGCRLVAAIHDECLISMPEDQWLHERAMEASRIWIDGMRFITPDVNVRAEPAAMRRWNKSAEYVLGPDERLRVWEPTVKYKTDSKGRLRSDT